jgi:hypothetical protein
MMSYPKKAHRRRWLALLLGGFLLTVFLAFFFWWQHYKTTPAYSLALLVDATQRNDDAAFDRIVDIEKVVDNFVPQLAQRGTGNLAVDLATSLRTRLQSLMPGMTESIKQVVKEEIRNDIRTLAGRSAAAPFFLTALAIPFRANISESEDTAKVTINNGDKRVELFMERRAGSQWRVVSLRDDAHAARILQDLARELPGSGSQLDQEMRKQLQQKLPELPEFPLLDNK